VRGWPRLWFTSSVRPAYHHSPGVDDRSHGWYMRGTEWGPDQQEAEQDVSLDVRAGTVATRRSLDGWDGARRSRGMPSGRTRMPAFADSISASVGIPATLRVPRRLRGRTASLGSRHHGVAADGVRGPPAGRCWQDRIPAEATTLAQMKGARPAFAGDGLLCAWQIAPYHRTCSVSSNWSLDANLTVLG